MACAQDKYPYPRPRVVMDEDLSGVEQINSVPTQTNFFGVKIREFDDSTANPEPIKQDEDTDQLLEEFLSANKLRSLTGVKNLQDAHFLEMKVDTRDNSLGNFGTMLPNLLQLKLSNSILATVRDLGTSLKNLRTLWLARCGLADLDGISSLCSLKELYLAFNDIVDVSPVSMVDQLEVLDLEGNLVDDLSQVEFLCLCSSLRTLTLEGNPLCISPHPNSTPQECESYDYRSAIHKAVPNVKHLDDEPFLVEKVGGKEVLRQMPEALKNNRVPEHLKTDWQLISDGLKADLFEQDEGENMYPSTATSGQRPASARSDRPSTAASRRRPGSASRQRPSTAMGQGPTSPAGQPAELITLFQHDDSSDLTHGSSQVICGNISRALKARRQDINKTESPPALFVKDSSPIFKPEKSYEVEEQHSPSKQDVFQELRAWRQEYAQILDSDRILPTTRETESSSDSESPLASPRQERTSQASPVFSPSPPSSGSPSGARRSLHTPPLVGRDVSSRPHTSAGFRVRRLRQHSGEESVVKLKLRTLHGDECFDVDKNPASPLVASSLPLSLLGRVEVEPRSSSAPVKAKRRFRQLAVTPEAKGSDTAGPTSRGHRSPVDPLHVQRPGTAAAALQKRWLNPSKR